jgi:hypothetical protein
MYYAVLMYVILYVCQSSMQWLPLGLCPRMVNIGQKAGIHRDPSMVVNEQTHISYRESTPILQSVASQFTDTAVPAPVQASTNQLSFL